MKIHLPIGRKLCFSHFLAVLLISGSVGTYLYFSAVSSLLANLRTRLQNSAALVSQALDARDLAGIRTESDVSLPAYSDALEKLRRFRSTNPDIAFLYVMRRVEDQVLFVVDSDETDRQALPGRPYPSAPPALLAGFTSPSVDEQTWEDEWGTFLSGYAPLRNGEGEYLVGLDMRATEIQNKLRQIRTAGVLSLGFSIFLAILFSRLLSSQLITPIRLLIDRCSAIAEGRPDKSIDLRTGDELEQLIRAFNTMSGHLGESQEQNRKTEEALKKARHNLELRVDERTRELKELNEKLLHEIGERKKAEEALALVASSDSLTGTLNRRAMAERLHYQVVQFERNCSPFAVLLCDVDHFKPINDTFGHDAGDKVLTNVADRLRKAVRKQDLVARWGGEEFLMMLPDTDLEGGLEVAEKMLHTVESDVFLADSQRLKLTLSVGVSVFSQGQTVDDCIKAADKALYQAKRQGRNRVVVAQEPIRQASGGEGIGGFDASLPLAECDRSQVR